MARLSITLVLVLAAAVLVTAKVNPGKPKKKFPPNKLKGISEKEAGQHPQFKPSAKHRGIAAIPTAFDARTQWPKCESIKLIRDQGQCGTCWAVSSASVLSDRICIASGQKTNVLISANQAASCSVPGQSGDDNCEAGGDPANVYKYTSLQGLPTGGEFNSNKGCVPYQVGGESAPPLTCSKKCTNTGYTTPLANDLNVVDSYWIDYKKKDVKLSQAEIAASVNKMQTDIMANGPITATLKVWDDFQNWDASDGLCYRAPGPGAKDLGGHAVRIIGWNKDKAGTPYWMIANSWGTDVGDKGIYWLEMGKNAIGIESTISAPIVKMPNNCDGASFCDTPIDLAVLTKIKDPKSPTYLFQGNCTQQVSVGADGKLKAIGPAVPLSKVFLGAPSGPMTSSIVQNDQLWLLNSKGQAGANCAQSAGSTKFTCGGGSGSGSGGASANFYTGSTLNTWSYYPDNKDWLFNTQGQGKNIGKLISDKFASVTSMLNVDGKKAVVFGKDASGKPVSGVLSYPSATQAGFTWATPPGPTSSLLTCSPSS
ncbi:putative Cathepsin B-like cysteine proteinase 4 [Hypsibius exemplaris]|uniref:Cathepsin B-like cysteine proteinase 4 n=1 Tax=Hypsibius exemplaris TaxID=2072580 RepID=A0A1W0WRS1_HYPEX|nr:putative Cathepsin B-like cysteine proteinase 4 [Hypsibius exemplaris]